MSDLLRIGIVLALVAGNAFFVAAAGARITALRVTLPRSQVASIRP